MPPVHQYRSEMHTLLPSGSVTQCRYTPSCAPSPPVTLNRGGPSARPAQKIGRASRNVSAVVKLRGVTEWHRCHSGRVHRRHVHRAWMAGAERMSVRADSGPSPTEKHGWHCTSPEWRRPARPLLSDNRQNRRSITENWTGRGIVMAARKKSNDMYLWGGIIAIGLYFITRHEWANLTTYLPIVFFFLAWFFFLVMPTKCCFPGRKGPCRNTSYGIIFGCRRYHWLMKARAKLGIG